ncbi:MAG: DMT family transporter [Alphaproteobacteria bacterium]|nr:DMT family transporter [Alphaproteobacteria bacterium]
MVSSQNLRGVGYMMLSGLVFVFNDVLLKLAMGGLPPYEVLALRGISGAFFALVFIWRSGGARIAPSQMGRPVFLRAGFECLAILTYIIALAHAPIGDVTAIFQTTPLLVFLGMVVIHREKTSLARLGLVVLGFAGALLVAQPGQGTVSPLVLLAFITTVFAALRDLAARQIPASVPALVSTLVLILTVLSGALACGLLFEKWEVPPLKIAGLAFAAGLFMMLGHHYTLLAYRTAAAQIIAPFYYSFMVFAVGFGYVVFGDVPNWLGVGGMVLIVVSGLLILTLDRRTATSEPEPSA